MIESLKKSFTHLNDSDLLLHSDRGFQYTSREYPLLTSICGVTRSMSRVGKYIDNAPMENFWGHFRTECYYWIKCETYEKLVEMIKNYIRFYSTQRYQTKLNSLIPEEY